MQLTGIRSLYVHPVAQSVPAVSQEEDGEQSTAQRDCATVRARFRRVRRSPAQELLARLEAGAGTDPLPDALAAILLYEHRVLQVQRNGLAFELNGTRHRYWSADSVTCHPSNVGSKARIAFNRDNLDCVFVLSDEGEYLETLPHADKHDWFSQEAGEEIAKYKRVATHVHEYLKRTHGPTTAMEHARAKGNAETLQIVNALPAPEPSRNTPAGEATPTLVSGVPARGTFRKAEAIAEAEAEAQEARQSRRNAARVDVVGETLKRAKAREQSAQVVNEDAWV
jgi:hypothetical protein